MNYKKKIAEEIVKAYNKGLKTLNVDKVDSNYRNYSSVGLFEEINSAAKAMERDGYFVIKYVKFTELIDKLVINAEKIKQLANTYNLKLKDDIDEQAIQILKKYENSQHDEIKTFINQQKENLANNKSVRFYTTNSMDLEDVLMAWDAILSQEEYIKLRNLSSKIFKNSKRLEKIIPTLWPLVSSAYNDMEGSVVEKQEYFLNEHNVYKNSIYVMIKGKGVIYFQNGERITLTDYLGPTQFSKEYVDKMTRIETKQILTIENLTTFEDFNMNEFDGIVLYLGGFSNKVNVSFIKKANMPIKHFGDIDANGFKILYNLKEQLEQPVDAYMMDMNTILKCEDRGTSMDDEKFKHNRVKLQTMMSDEKYTKEERELFEYLLKIDKIFEQEAISDLIC